MTIYSNNMIILWQAQGLTPGVSRNSFHESCFNMKELFFLLEYLHISNNTNVYTLTTVAERMILLKAPHTNPENWSLQKNTRHLITDILKQNVKVALPFYALGICVSENNGSISKSSVYRH